MNLNEAPDESMTAMADSISADLFPSDAPEPESRASTPAMPSETPPPSAEATPPPPTPEALRVPDSWRKETHELWSQLPRSVQEEVHRREADIHRGIESYRSRAQIADRFSAILDPYSQILQSERADPFEIFSNMMQHHYTLMTAPPEQKAALWSRLQQYYGITPPTEPEFVDPQVADLRNKFSTLQSRLEARDQEAQAAENAKANELVAKFAADPEHRYFKELVPDILRIVQSGERDLQKAYDTALWANPATRAKEIERLDAAKAEEAAAKARSARAATAANIRHRDKNRSSAAPLGSIDDTIAETLAAIRGR